MPNLGAMMPDLGTQVKPVSSTLASNGEGSASQPSGSPYNQQPGIIRLEMMFSWLGVQANAAPRIHRPVVAGQQGSNPAAEKWKRPQATATAASTWLRGTATNFHLELCWAAA
jgi:hypothetical protein